MKRQEKRGGRSSRGQPDDSSDSFPGGLQLSAYLSLTTQCNLHCKGCYAVPERGPSQCMDYELAQAILGKLAQLGFGVAWFGGGEPLLYPQLFDLAEYARSLSLLPRMTTNGTFLDNAAARRCRVFDRIHVSLCALDHLPALEAARHALARAGITPALDVLLTNKTFPHLREIFAWARLMKLSQLQLIKFKVTAENERHRNLQLFAEQERELPPLALSLSRKHHLVARLDCAFSPLAEACRLSPREVEQLGLSGCPGGLHTLAIDEAGRYKPCLFWHETLGHALDLSLDEWLHGEKLARFRQQAGSENCVGCQYLSACNQGCRLYAEQMCDHEDRR
ncbi:radical SAM protein [bacterium]|nr:radical SAM protein [bacterium]